jgi:hypothetical protein
MVSVMKTTTSCFTYLLIIAAAFTSLGQAVRAQMPDVKAPVQAAMQQTAVMVGEWRGTSSSIRPDGSREIAEMHEQIRWKLDETVLLIEGRGVNESGEVAHNALAVLSFDPFTRSYKFNSHIAQGLQTAASFEVLEPNVKFRWGYETLAGKIRFTLTFSEDGTHWHEIGEFSRDGETWFPTLEMNLDKV